MCVPQDIVATEKLVVFNGLYFPNNHKNYNLLNCDWFKKLLFPTNSLAKLLSDSLLPDSSTNQSHSKL